MRTPRSRQAKLEEERPSWPDKQNVHLDTYLYFVAENAKSWYFQHGHTTVDPILHGTPPPLDKAS